MKIQIYATDFLEMFPKYKNMLMADYYKYRDLLESNHYHIEKIKNKNARKIFNIQLSTKEDFNIQVVEQSGNWEIKTINQDIKDILVALLLRNEKVVLNYDTTNLDNIDMVEYLNHKYDIYVKKYEQKNYIGEGHINWNDINSEVKNNWEKSFFFLDNMNNEQFVENNKELILEKVKDDNNLLKEAITKSNKFFNFAVGKINLVNLLEVLSDKEAYLCEIYNTKIKDIRKHCDYKKMIEDEKLAIQEELNNCWQYMMQNSFNRYGDLEDTGQYNRLKERLHKHLKSREKEIKQQTEQNQIVMQQIDQLLENPILRKNLIKGLLKNDIFKEDFVYFEKDILIDEELRSLVLRKGLYKTLATSKNFVDTLNEEEFERFVITCSQRLEKSLFSGDDKKHFQKIVNEERLLGLLKHVIKEGKVSVEKFKLNNHQDFKILSEYNTKNKELKKCLFYVFPKDRFSELSKDEIKEEDIKYYLNAGGFVYNVKEKINIYNLTDIETIKLICSQDSEVLRNKKTPPEWKNNIEIIKQIVQSRGDLEYSGIKKENILQMCENINDVKTIVKQDKNHYFYKNLPDKLKNDKQIALALLESSDIEEIIPVLPEFILKDKRFNIELIKKSPESIKNLKDDIWNDKEFVLTLLSEIENTPKEKQVGENLPSTIKLFFETFNIHENYYTFFNNYQLQKKLQEKLVADEGKVKEKKMKI